MEHFHWDCLISLLFGVDFDCNFVIQMSHFTKEEFVHILRRQSTGFARGSSKYRGVTLHKCGRWEARMGQLLGKKWETLSSFLLLFSVYVLILHLKFWILVLEFICGLNKCDKWTREHRICVHQGPNEQLGLGLCKFIGWIQKLVFIGYVISWLACRYIYLGLFDSEIEAARSVR